MKRLLESRERATHWTSVICPKILHKIEVIEKQAAGYITTQCDFNLFEVSCLYGDQQEVDLEKRSCSCRVWDLTGIPCKHAVSAIWLKHGKGPVFDYVHPCYRTETYMKIYAGSIKPMAGPEEWPLSDMDPPLPPQYTARPGRPKKLRKRSACELSKDGEKVARTHIKLHCTKCRKPGHNARTCPLNLPNLQKQKPRKKVGSNSHVLTEEAQAVIDEVVGHLHNTAESEHMEGDDSALVEVDFLTHDGADFGLFEQCTPIEIEPTPQRRN